MNRSIVTVFTFCVLVGTSIAQRHHEVFSSPRTQTIASVVAQSTVVTVNALEIQSLVQEKAPRISFTVPMPQGVNLALTLERMSVVTAGSRLTVMTENGPQHSILGNSLLWYRTTLPGNGMAVFCFDVSGNVSGMIDAQSGRFVIGHKTGDTNPYAYVIASEKSKPFSCGTPTEMMSSELDKLIAESHRAVAKASEDAQAGDTIVMEIAVEADYQLRRKLGTIELATTYVTQLIAILSTIYERDLAVKFVITNVRIWDTSQDPYTDSKGIFGGLLDEFVTEYRTKMTAIPRDLALFLTAKGGSGGIARTIGGICQEDGSYCAGDVLGTLEPGLSGFTWDIIMMAHEIGHVCGGLHTQSCLWPTGPLDSCVASEDGVCVSYEMIRPARGTIMSYCQQQLGNGATIVYEFHPLSRSVLRSYIRSAACLGNEPQQRTSVIQGYVRNSKSGQPIAGANLVLGRYIDDLIRQVPPVAGDTVVTTQADGSYRFSGLGMGIYYVEVQGNYVPYPLDLSGNAFPNPIQVADSISRFDIMVSAGQQIEILIATKDRTTEYSLHLYTEEVASLYKKVATPSGIQRRDDSTLRFVGFVPSGRYIIVPIAPRQIFTPNKIVIDVTADQAQSPYVINTTYTGSSGLTTIALGVASVPASPTTERAKLGGGMEYRAFNTANSASLSNGIVPEDGVLVIERVPTASQYKMGLQLDTANMAPYSGGEYLYPNYQYVAGMYIQQSRRKPVLARAYRMSVRQSAYTPLVSPTILWDSSNRFVDTMRIDLPFTLRILDRELSTLTVAQNGFVAFGGQRVSTLQITPLSEPWVQSPFVVGPFIVNMQLDSTSQWHIAWTIEGSEPDRVIKVEWKKLNALIYVNGDYYNQQSVGPFSFQAHIYENGVIDMVYDRADSVQAPFYFAAGLRGNDIMDNNVVVQTDTTSLENVAASFLHETTSAVRLSMHSMMKKGLTYHWELQATDVVDNAVSESQAIPTPATSLVTLTGIVGPTNIRVVDALGAVVLLGQLDVGSTRINVGALASGRYSVLLNTPTGTRVVPVLIHR